MTPDYMTFWFAMTPGIRMGILFLVFAFLFKRLIIYVLKQTPYVLSKVLSGILSFFFFIFESVLGMIIRLVGKKLEVKWALMYEKFLNDFLSKLNQIGNIAGTKNTDNKTTNKRYWKYVFSLALLFIFLSYKHPNFPLIKSLNEAESTFIQEKLDVEIINTVQARNILAAWTESWNEQETVAETSSPVVTELTLTAQNSRGNIRETPNMKSKIIRTIHTGDKVIFLKEESVDAEKRKWYKVKTDDNLVGWISSRIVK